jgi:O-antigen ligase
MALPGATALLRVGPPLVAVLSGGAVGVGVASGLGWGSTAALLAGAAAFGALATAAAIAAFGGLRRVVLATIVLDTSVQVDAYLGYREVVGDLGALGGLNVSLTTLALAVLYALWLAEALVRPQAVARPRWRAAGAGALYVAAVAFAAAFAVDPALAAFELWLLAQMLLLFVVWTAASRDRSDVVFVVGVLLASVVLQGAVTVASGFTHVTFDAGGVSNAVDESYRRGSVWRAGGTIGSPNAAAAFFAMLLPPAAALVLTQRRSWLTWLAAAALLAGAAGLIVTRSRGGMAATAVALAIVLIVLYAERALTARTVRRLILGALVLLPLALPLLGSRLRVDDDAAASRSPLNTIALRMIADHPLVGVGPNHFALALPRYATAEFAREWLYTVHNKYLLVASEAGLPALAAFLGFLAVALRRAVRAFRRNDGLAATLALGFGAALVGQLVHMTVDVFNSRPSVQLLWLVVAIVTCLAATSARPGPRKALR